MVQTTWNFELLDKKQNKTKQNKTKNGFKKLFLKNGFCNWNNCLMLNYNLKITVFQFSENDSSPTLVTRLKVTTNMADPVSLKNSDRCLKVPQWGTLFL